MLAEAVQTPKIIIDASAAAEAALNSAGSPAESGAGPSHWPEVLAHEQAEMERLVNAIVEPQSVALQRAISRTADLKIKAVEAGKVGMPEPSDEEQAAWAAAREALNDEAYAMSEAPITTASDALIRGEAFIDAVGRNRKTGLTEDDSGDLLQLVASYRDALETLAAREPDTTEWNDALLAWRRIERAVANASDELDGVERAAMVDDGIREGVEARLAGLYPQRDEARLKLLSMEPPNVGGLLVQLGIVCDQAMKGDQSSYVSRENGLGGAAFTVDELWQSDDRRAFTLIATNAARLRDRELPADWRAIFDEAQTPAARDAVRNAVDAGLASEDVTDAFLRPTNPKHPPFLAITTPAGQQLLSKPDHVWEWKACQ